MLRTNESFNPADTRYYKPELQSLYIMLVKLNEQDIHNVIDFLETHKEVTQLTLYKNQLNDKCLKLLLTYLTINSSITSLTISDNKINDYHIQEFFAKFLSVNTPLAKLNLALNEITQNGARMLGNALLKNNIMIELNLCRNDIGEEGASFLNSLFGPLSISAENNNQVATISLLMDDKYAYQANENTLSILKKETTSFRQLPPISLLIEKIPDQFQLSTSLNKNYLHYGLNCSQENWTKYVVIPYLRDRKQICKVKISTEIYDQITVDCILQIINACPHLEYLELVGQIGINYQSIIKNEVEKKSYQMKFTCQQNVHLFYNETAHYRYLVDSVEKFKLMLETAKKAEIDSFSNVNIFSLSLKQKICSNDFITFVIPYLQQHTEITSLSLNINDIDDSALITFIKTHTKIIHLNLSNRSIGSAVIEALAEYPLQTLILNDAINIPDDVLAAMITQNKKLLKLKMHFKTGHRIYKTMQAISMSNISELDLANSQFTSVACQCIEEIKYLAECENIKFLNLSACNLSDGMMRILARSAILSVLELDLSNNNINDNELYSLPTQRVLCRLINNNALLTQLNLAEIRISENLALTIANHPSLRKVNIDNCQLSQLAASILATNGQLEVIHNYSHLDANYHFLNQLDFQKRKTLPAELFAEVKKLKNADSIIQLYQPSLASMALFTTKNYFLHKSCAKYQLRLISDIKRNINELKPMTIYCDFGYYYNKIYSGARFSYRFLTADQKIKQGYFLINSGKFYFDLGIENSNQCLIENQKEFMPQILKQLAADGCITVLPPEVNVTPEIRSMIDGKRC